MDGNISFPSGNPDPINHVKPAEDVISAPARHGCPDLTDDIDLAACSNSPQAEGGFCDVYQGRLNDGVYIAIKSLRLYDRFGYDSEKEKMLKRAERELYHWSKLKHPNILPLMGLAMFRGHLSMISEWMQNGSLMAYISLNPDADRISLCIDICVGLSHVHANNMVHGDMKAANVMVSLSGMAMIADFGNSHIKDLTLRFTNTTTASFSVRWAVLSRISFLSLADKLRQAPELLLGEANDARRSKESDVYAYGMTVLETMTGKVPFEEFSDQKVLAMVALRFQTPARPRAGISNETWQLLQRCWARGKSTRPDIRGVQKLLRDIHIQTRIETKKGDNVKTVHFKASTQQSLSTHIYFKRRLRVLVDIAGEHAGRGQLALAESLGLEAMAFQKRVLGGNNPDTLRNMHILALTYEQQDRLAEAESLGVDVLVARGKMLGENHPDTLRSVNNLSITYMKQGRLTEAELLSVAVVDVIKRVLGDDHPDTLQSMNTLAVTYEKQDRLAEAELLGAEVVAARKRVLGEGHADTLQSMSNLAIVYTQLGRLAEGEFLEVKVVTGRRRVLGKYHPDTLRSMMNLAITYEEQGRLAMAEPLGVKVVALRKQVLGGDHPQTLQSMHTLAFTYRKHDRLAEAEWLSAEVVAARKRTLGEDHLDTLLSIGILALTYEKQGRLSEAESLVSELLAVRERILGKRHPHAVSTLRWLGRIAQAKYDSIVTQVDNWRVKFH